jgi:hypothetical protein
MLAYGFAERKLIMILDIYDIVKKVKKYVKTLRVNTKAEIGPHASDVAKMSYQIVNHKKREVKEFEVIHNSSLSKTTLTVKNIVDIPKDILKSGNFNHTHYAEIMNNLK